MHIKQITISGFRSFKQQPEIQPFAPGSNSLVGRNGSGKSNLFDAVEFVLLTPRFYTLRAEERQALLHEGAGNTAVNAFVEIVFDNSDNRFSLENSDEVVLRRTVGQKKDEFFLQRKRANKTEIMSLLEGAGFSKSNPYYIVQQGKVNALCTMNDADRLKLLKEVAGTTVYDEKKSESLKKMEENQASIEKIQEILSTIENRLQELHGEKEELTQYQKLDKVRRAMEYTVYDKELRKARETLDMIETERSNATGILSGLYEEAREMDDRLKTVEQALKSKAKKLKHNRNLVKTLEADMTKAMRHHTRLELECKELRDAVKSGDELQKQNELELKELGEEINKAEKELEETVSPKYDKAVNALQLLKNEEQEAKKKLEGLYAKQGRGRQFTTKEERNEYLQKSVDDLETAMTEKQNQLEQQQDKLSNLRRAIETETKNLEKERNQILEVSATLESCSKSIDEKKRARLEAYDKRREQQRKTEDLLSRVKESRENNYRAHSNMRKVMPKATAMGLQALEEIVPQQRIVVGEQYFGMVMDNLELTEERFQTAVEVAAQNALFHVIVDTDATAAKLMRCLERERRGRVTFLPLNRLRVDRVRYPDTTDVKPLLSQCIRHEARVDPAMKHIFNKKLLARDIDVASAWSKRCQMDAITRDGDLVSRKGALTGGYRDEKRSRLRAHANHKAAKLALRDAQTAHQDAVRQANAFDQACTKLLGELQRLEAKQGNLNHKLQEMDGNVNRVEAQLNHRKEVIDTTEKTTIPALENAIASLKAEAGRLRDEMETELTTTLTEEERLMLVQLKEAQARLATDIESQTEAVSEITVEHQRLSSLIKDNLHKRRQELLQESDTDIVDVTRRMSRRHGKATSAALAQEQRMEDLDEREREFDEATRIVGDLEKKLAEAQKVEISLKSEMTEATNDFEKFKSVDTQNSKKLERAQDKAEKLLNKRSMTVSKREEYVQKIQELGSLPPHSELAKHADLSVSALMRELDKANKKLKKYSHVNKKAYDQYVNFSEQRESLLKRKEELDQGAEKVKELIESLDRQKDEAINRTFRGVSSNFKEVFQELVPNGAGELIMKSAMDDHSDESGDESDDDDDDDDEKKKKAKHPNVNLYRGIGIKIRFSAVGENYMMSQLSGGQKALVAMALIFAIQRSDPAPFYLFDELDQALDSTHRQAVADLIQRQSQDEETPAQFIFSTFRPELVAISDRCFGISHQNKVSSIHHLNKKDALHFIANLQTEEEAVGEVTAVRASRKRKAPEGEEKEEDAPAAS